MSAVVDGPLDQNNVAMPPDDNKVVEKLDSNKETQIDMKPLENAIDIEGDGEKKKKKKRKKKKKTGQTSKLVYNIF